MKSKRILSLILAGVMGATLFAGCSKKGDDKVEVKNKGAAVEKLEGNLASKNPIQQTIHLHSYNRLIYKDEWPVFKKAAEITNVSLKGAAPQSATNSEQVFNIMMASGDLPDIVVTERENFFKYGPEGAFVPLNELIDKYAPNYKKYLESNPNIKKFTTSPDGKIYSINFVPDGEAAEGYFIRQDWLDKLNLKVPTTVNEYYEVLKAFREKDPNGNGKKDEIPFIDRAKGKKTTQLCSLWGAYDAWYAKDGKVIYGPMDEAYKTAMINISKWYKEGLIDPEAFTRGANARNILFENNTGGSTHDWFATTALFNDSLKTKVPGFSVQPIAPPADVNGKVWEITSRPMMNKTGWGISKSNKNPEATMRYFDFWWSEEGRRLMNFGIEGQTYDMVNGKPIFKDSILKTTKTVTQELEAIGAQIQVGFHQDFSYEEQWMNPVAKQGAKMYIDKKYIVPEFPLLSYTTEEQKVINEKGTSIDTLIKEQTQKWILGAESVETTWDKYISTLKNMGVNDLIKVQQTAYDNFNKAK